MSGLFQNASNAPSAKRDDQRRDFRAEHIAADSAVGQLLRVFITSFERAWPESLVGRQLREWSSAVGALSAVAQVTFVALVALSAAATALIGRLLAPRPEPLTWLVPAVVGVCALGCILVLRRSGWSNGPSRVSNRDRIS